MTNTINLILNNIDYFDSITIENSFGKSLKQIKFKDINNMDTIVNDINRISQNFIIPQCQELEWRLKAVESAALKLNKYQKLEKTSNNFYRLNSCLNDLIGFRIKSNDDKNTVFQELLEQDKFRVVNLLDGKQIDDGYRALHLYREISGLYYPVEIQIWFNEDYEYNHWMHKYAYKILNADKMSSLFKMYEEGKINSEIDFIKSIESLKENNNLFSWD